jgi:hypothetical protein
LVFIALAASVIFILPGCSEPESDIYTVEVPVIIRDAENIGVLHVELLYDDRLAEPVAVKKGDLVGDGIFSYSIDNPAVVVIGISRMALNGNGTIAEIKFRVNGAAVLPVDLVLTNVLGRDASTNIKLDLDFTHGSIDSQEKTFVSPEIITLR